MKIRKMANGDHIMDADAFLKFLGAQSSAEQSSAPHCLPRCSACAFYGVNGKGQPVCRYGVPTATKGWPRIPDETGTAFCSSFTFFATPYVPVMPFRDRDRAVLQLGLSHDEHEHEQEHD